MKRLAEDIDKVSLKSFKALRQYMQMRDLDPDVLRSKSSAASGLASWLHEMYIFIGLRLGQDTTINYQADQSA